MWGIIEAARTAWCETSSGPPFRPVMPAFDAAAARVLRSLSLDALRGFDAAARRASFTAAADELCLTQSAVSKQVKALEQVLGKPLFVRGPRGLALTDEGQALHQAVSPVLRTLEQALGALAGAVRRTVSVSVTPSFASLWLAPRLAAYQRAAPDIDVRIDASEQPRQLAREGIDLALRQAAPGRAEPGSRPLLQEWVRPLAAPALAARVHVPADLARLPLLVFRHAVERHPAMSWSHWFDRLGLAPSRTQPLIHFSQYEHLLKAAAEGAGIALGRRPLVDPLLREGRLAPLLPGRADLAQPGLVHHLLVAPSAAARVEVAAFVAWLEAELAAGGPDYSGIW